MKKILILFLLVFMIFPSIAFCETTTKKLENDTDLHPYGWLAGSIKFKAGTNVMLNEKGEVISGVLKYYEHLHTVGGWSVMTPGGFGGQANAGGVSFKGDTTFNQNGFVVSGTLGEDTDISLYGGFDPHVKFKSNTKISFNSNGSVALGTIKSDTYLRPIGWINNLDINNSGFVKFKADTEITFVNKGEVISGTLAEDTTVRTTSENKKILPLNTFITFDEKGRCITKN